MRLKIIHETEYQYSELVFLEPHYLRFKPKNTPFIGLESYKFSVSPKPIGISEHIDAENNFVHFCWFEGMHKQLNISWELITDSKDHNPFSFILFPESYLTIPFKYDESLNEILQSSLKFEKLDQSLVDFGNQILHESNGDTINFLTSLTNQIHDNFKLIIRLEGSPYSANKTFKLKVGSCRDLAWMQIQLLRSMGVATRFVSGYYYLPLDNSDFELHAWIEVFLPGAGWIGFDPSHGIIAGESHIPIASSAHYENVMAISGTVRGDATSIMETKLMIESI